MGSCRVLDLIKLGLRHRVLVCAFAVESETMLIQRDRETIKIVAVGPCRRAQSYTMMNTMTAHSPGVG
jgi:hypothetical protein